MKILFSVFALIFPVCLLFAVIPLPGSPSWTSIDNDYSTGGALYDVTMDGWIEYCTGNGNDMASNRNGIYVNSSGTLETVASWRSTESGYFSHIYIGDVNNDGRPDMAVSYLGSGSSNRGPTRIYRNTGTGLNTTAWWASTDQYNSFDCAFGDVDLDGDLDLAVAAGDAYSNVRSPARVYRNNSGTIETNPYWTARDSTPSDACRWVDLNNDGYLDLVVGYRRKLLVFRNISGTLEQNPSWSTNRPGWILRIAVGDYNKDGYKDIAIASNGQLSGDSSRIEVFRNVSGTLQTPPAYVMLRNTVYCSCVEWGDVNNDGWLDLAAGGWWESVVVFENNSGTINTTPAWSWSGGGNLVCETVMWNDVRNKFLTTYTEYKSGDGSRRLFYLEHHPIQSFQDVRVNSIPVPLSDFTYDPLTGWITLKNAPPIGTNNIEIRYTYSRYPDLGVTNWTSSVGNYLFSNTTVPVEEESKLIVHNKKLLNIYPNPARERIAIKFQIVNQRQDTGSQPAPLSRVMLGSQDISLKIYDAGGRLVRQLDYQTLRQSDNVIWSGDDDFGRKVPAGVYFVELKLGQEIQKEKLVIVR